MAQGEVEKLYFVKLKTFRFEQMCTNAHLNKSVQLKVLKYIEQYHSMNSVQLRDENGIWRRL